MTATTLITDTRARTAKRLAYLAIVVAMLLTLAMARVLRPTTLKADVLFSTWLLLPYALLAALVAIGSRDRTAALANLAAVLLIAAGGLKFLADVIFFHPDAQGPIALLMVPLLQGLGMVVAVPIAHWAFRRYSKRHGTPNRH